MVEQVLRLRQITVQAGVAAQAQRGLPEHLQQAVLVVLVLHHLFLVRL